MDDPALANDKYRATLRSTFIDGSDTTLAVTAIPTNLPTIVTVGWNTQYETVFRVEGTSGTNSSNYTLTGITKIKGYTGNLPENSAVNCLNHEEYFNQYGELIAAIQEVADEALASLENFAVDAGSTDAYQVTIASITSYVAGTVVKFDANTVNTGAATLQVNALGTKTIKKHYNMDLMDGDIQAGQLVEVIYDGTNFQLLSPTARQAITLARNVTEVTISNSSAETTLLTHSLLANLLGTSRWVKIKMFGKATNTTGGNVSFNWALKLGATTLDSSSRVIVNDTGTVDWIAEFLIAADGATNAQKGGFGVHGQGQAGGGNYQWSGSGSSAIDTTANADIVVTMTLGTASSSATFIMEGYEIELI